MVVVLLVGRPPIPPTMAVMCVRGGMMLSGRKRERVACVESANGNTSGGMAGSARGRRCELFACERRWEWLLREWVHCVEG